MRRCYDAAVIDVGLPGIDGFALARSARAEGVQTPILMLTARDAVEDRVAGLDCGADDYLVKPFVEEELVARIARDPAPRRPADGRRRRSRSAAHRPRGRAASATTASRSSWARRSFACSEFLARNAGIALSRTQIVERIWDYDFDGSSNIVDVYVSQLRRKLKALGASGVIETVWGIGYRLKAG